MDNPEEFRCISLCSGYAGIELGLRRVIPALRTIAYVEREGFACANLVAKIEAGQLDAAPIWTDIKTFDGRPFCKRVHIITAGYPCQGESHAGKRKGQNDPRWLWPNIARIIETVQPLWFFGENVSGHLSLGFPTVYRSLRNLGYKVEAGLFTAEEIGAPHKRERLFILAHARCYEQRRNSGNGKKKDGFAQERQSANRRNSKSSSSSELADTCSQGLQEQTRGELQSLPCEAKQSKGSESCGIYAETRWPSRPGQPQYEWEEPRTTNLGNTTHRITTSRGNIIQGECKKGKNGETIGTRCAMQNQGRSKKQKAAQSRLGRAANGTKSRVDRLRLLGNGVVPQQAEKAFRELMKLFEANP